MVGRSARAEHAPQLLYFQARRLTADAAISSTSLAGVAPSRVTSRAVPARPRQSIVPSAKDLVDQSSYYSMRAFRRPFVELHELGFYALPILIVLHLIGVVTTEVHEGLRPFASALGPVNSVCNHRVPRRRGALSR